MGQPTTDRTDGGSNPSTPARPPSGWSMGAPPQGGGRESGAPTSQFNSVHAPVEESGVLAALSRRRFSRVQIPSGALASEADLRGVRDHKSLSTEQRVRQSESMSQPSPGGKWR